jgi:hypothetical protein
VLATAHLDAAGQVASGMSVTDVEIAYQLASFKAELVRTELDPAGQLDIARLESIVARVEVLIETLGLSLATPEVIAARGVLAFEEGSVEDAGAHWDRAISEARRQGNALTPSSPRSVVHWLGRLIERAATPAPTGLASDLIDRVGTPLSADWMIEVLREVAGTRLT